jgi:hypothetical protein
MLSSVGTKSRIVLVLALAAVCATVIWFLHTPPPRDVAALTPEAKAYVKYLDLSDVQMKATETYLKQTVTEIEGTIQNKGDRPLHSVEIVCVFYDPYGQIVLRERVAIVKPSAAPLKPGETRAFRLPFDNIPESWNNQMPSLVIAAITFA